MKIPLRSLAAVAVLSLALNACTAISARQIETPSEVEQELSTQDAAGNTWGQNMTYPGPTSSDEGQTLIDETTATREVSVWPNEQVRTDQQGAVEIAMLPVNLNHPQDTLDFQVSLNTHSVDLSMDLAALALLRTDSGVEVKASAWTGPSGGHHVSGILSFPSVVDGEGVLEGATVLELAVMNLDAPERVFVWER